MSSESWAVTVERNGEQVVTIASNCLSGRDLSADDERIIETAARHLLAFLGHSELITIVNSVNSVGRSVVSPASDPQTPETDQETGR